MKAVLPFLNQLSANNNRDWFNTNKALYLEAKGQFDQFIDSLINRLQVFDPAVRGANAKNTVFRIYRDVRFSKDKSPYKTHFGAYMIGGGRKSPLPGYYIHIDPERSFLGGGLYQPASDYLKAVRIEIQDFSEDFKAIVEDKAFQGDFTLYDEDKLKRPPQGFDADDPMIEYLKYRHFIASHVFPNSWIEKDDFIDNVAKQFERIYPLNQFLNRAIQLD